MTSQINWLQNIMYLRLPLCNFSVFYIAPVSILMDLTCLLHATEAVLDDSLNQMLLSSDCTFLINICMHQRHVPRKWETTYFSYFSGRWRYVHEGMSTYSLSLIAKARFVSKLEFLISRLVTKWLNLEMVWAAKTIFVYTIFLHLRKNCLASLRCQFSD